MNRLTAIIISFYISIILYSNAFFTDDLIIATSNTGLFWNRLAIFAAFLALSYFTTEKFILTDGGGGMKRYMRLALRCAAVAGLTISVLYHIVPVDAVYTLPASLDNLFASDSAFTWWLLIPLAVLFI